MLSRSSYLAQPVFQILQLALLDDQVAVIVQVLHDIIMLLLVVFENNCLDRRVTFNQDTCRVGRSSEVFMMRTILRVLPRTARGILGVVRTLQIIYSVCNW